MTDAQAGAQTQADDKFKVLTFYILIDVSYSMGQNGGIDAANKLVGEIVAAVDNNPVLADLARIGVIDFSDDARTVIPLMDLRDVETIPQLEVRGGTSFAAAFTQLRQDIPADIRQLKDDGFLVHRPAVFFITDGEATDPPDELQAAFSELTSPSFPARPNIVPFGVGEASKESLEPWVFPPGKMRSFVAKEGVDPGTAVGRIAEILVSSIVASVSSVDEHGEAGGLVLPEDDELKDWL